MSGGEPQRRLVEQEKARAAHKRAGDGEHLLLAARERAATLGAPLAEDGKDAEHALEVFVEMTGRGRGRAHLQVLQHRHAGEDAPPFRRMGDAAAHDAEGGQVGDVLAVEGDGAAGGARVAANRHQQRGFSRAVGADQGDDLALVHLQIDAAKRLHRAVERMHAFHRQHYAASSASPR